MTGTVPARNKQHWWKVLYFNELVLKLYVELPSLWQGWKTLVKCCDVTSHLLKHRVTRSYLRQGDNLRCFSFGFGSCYNTQSTLIVGLVWSLLRSYILPESPGMEIWNFCKLYLLRVNYCDQDPGTESTFGLKVCRSCLSFQNQNIPDLAIGRKITRFIAFRCIMKQTCVMFETWLQLEPGLCKSLIMPL